MHLLLYIVKESNEKRGRSKLVGDGHFFKSVLKPHSK